MSLSKHQVALDAVGGAFTQAGLAATVGVGLIVKTSADFEEQMSRVAATGAEARASLDGLREAAMQAGPAVGRSATEAAQGVEDLLKAGVSAADVQGGGLAGALTLAAAGVMEVGDAAETAATAMTQFGLSGKEVPHIADLLAAGAGKAQGEVSDMAMALKQSGLVASQFGLSIEETVGTLTAFASAGLLGSDAGTSFRTMLLRLGNPSGEAAEQMQELGIAAYDSQGKFVGIAAVAEQLKTRLSGLTQAQRDQALATIFGSDAIRAANVLFTQGADGINQWVDATNEAGFASEVAATKMDNLKGDLSKLGATIQSAFIGAGEGSQGPLRGLVKNVTGLVEAFSKLPAPLQQGAVMVAGVGGASLLAAGGVMKLATSAADTYKTFRELVPAGSKLSGTLGVVGKAAAGLAAGLVAVNIAGAAIGKKAGLSTLEQMKSVLLDMAGGQGVGKLSDSFRDLVPGVTGLSDAVKKLDNPNHFRDLMAKVSGLSSDTEILQAQFAAMDGALALMDKEDASQAFAALSQELRDSGKSTEQITALFPQYRDSLLAAANATRTAAGGMGDLTSETTAATEALRKHGNELLELSGSQIGFEQAIDDTTKAIKETGAGLDLNTQKGRDNRRSLDQLAESSVAYIDKLRETGASSVKVSEAQDRARAAFIKAADAAGMGATKAAALADELLGIPKTINPRVHVIVEAPNITAFMNSLQRRINANPLYVPVRSPRQVYRAEGGYISGPGTATSDSIPAWLSNGEYVLRARAVERLGLHRLDHMNRTGTLPHFADGGYTGTRFGPSAPPQLGGSSSGSGPQITVSAITPADLRAALDGARLDLGNVDRITGHVTATLVTATRRG